MRTLAMRARMRRNLATVWDFNEYLPPYIAASRQPGSKRTLNSFGISIVFVIDELDENRS